MARVSEYAKKQIMKMDRDELLYTYSKLRLMEWPKALGTKPRVWDRGETYRYGLGFRIELPSRGSIAKAYRELIEAELGAREIRRIEAEGRYFRKDGRYEVHML